MWKYIIGALLSILAFGAGILIASLTAKRQKALATKPRKRKKPILSEEQSLFEKIKNQLSKSFVKPFYIVFIGFALAIACYLWPVVCNDESLNLNTNCIFQQALVVLHNTIKLFVVDSDFALITGAATGIENGALLTAYRVLGGIYFVGAPVFTAVTLLSFVKDLFSMLKIKTQKKRPVYIFSELNEMSLSIAKDIVNKSDEKRLMIFTDVYDDEDEKIRELIITAQRLGAICLSRDLSELKCKWFEQNIEKKYYIIGADQDENMKHVLKIVNRYKYLNARTIRKRVSKQILEEISKAAASDDVKNNVYLQDMLNDYYIYKEMRVLGTVKILDENGKSIKLNKKQRAQAIASKEAELEKTFQRLCQNELVQACTEEDREKVLDKYKKIKKTTTPLFPSYELIQKAIAKIKSGELDFDKMPEIYVYATNAESETLLDNLDKEYIHIRRINENRNLVFETMLKNRGVANELSRSIFDDVDRAYIGKEYTGNKQMNVAIIGLGGYGMELLKTLSWLGQAKGYYLNAFVFDGENAKQKLEVQAPEMLLHNYLGELDEQEDKEAKGKDISEICDTEASYSIHFYNKIDVKTTAFLNKIAEINKKTPFTAVYVTLGNDSLNVQTAMSIRRKLAREENDLVNPKIYAVVFNDSKTEVLQNATENKYNITYIGNLEEAFSQKTVEQKEIEQIGFAYHSCWTDVENPYKRRESLEQYDRTEYYRRSSMAQAFFYELTYDKVEYQTVGELARFEHNRWNAFMRADGFVACQTKAQKDIVVRKTHHDLKHFHEIGSYEQSKDFAFLVKNDKVRIIDKSQLGQENI